MMKFILLYLKKINNVTLDKSRKDNTISEETKENKIIDEQVEKYSPSNPFTKLKSIFVELMEWFR